MNFGTWLNKSCAMRTNPRQRAPLTRCNAIGRTYSDPSTCQTIASTGSQAWRKQSGGQCGSFQNLVLKGHAFGIVFLKPFFRGVSGGEDLDVPGVARVTKCSNT